MGAWREFQNYRFRNAIMQETDIEIAKSAIRWGAADWLEARDLLSLTNNGRVEPLSFLMGKSILILQGDLEGLHIEMKTTVMPLRN